MLLLLVHVQDLLERAPEVHVAPGVDDRVHGGVEVAEPRDHVDEHLGRRAARLAEREEQVDDEERQPADDEHAHDDAKRLGRLPLLGQRYALLVLQQLVDVLADGRGVRPRPLVFVLMVHCGCGRPAVAARAGGRVHLVAAARRVAHRFGHRCHRRCRRRRFIHAARRRPLGRRARLRLSTAAVRHGHLLGAAPQPAPRRYVDAQVRDAHHHQRYVERAHGRVHHVARVGGERARRPLVEHVGPVVPAD